MHIVSNFVFSRKLSWGEVMSESEGYTGELGKKDWDNRDCSCVDRTTRLQTN